MSARGYGGSLAGAISGGKAKEILGHCMKCKCQRQMANPQKQIMKGKSKNVAAKGKCVVCDCTMYKILSKEERECF